MSNKKPRVAVYCRVGSKDQLCEKKSEQMGNDREDEPGEAEESEEVS